MTLDMHYKLDTGCSYAVSTMRAHAKIVRGCRENGQQLLFFGCSSHTGQEPGICFHCFSHGDAERKKNCKLKRRGGIVLKEKKKEQHFKSLVADNQVLKKRLNDVEFGIIEGNDCKTKFYSGLPTWTVFLHLCQFLSLYRTLFCKLMLENEFLLVLIKLQLGFLEDIADQLVHVQSAC